MAAVAERSHDPRMASAVASASAVWHAVSITPLAGSSRGGLAIRRAPGTRPAAGPSVSGIVGEQRSLSRIVSRGRNVPLYMDRHDLPEVTPEQVAQAHLLDLAIAPKHDVQFLTYWFDPEAGAAFCLARANSPEEIAAVHAEAHGLVPNVIIPVAEDNVLRLLGKIEDPGASIASSAFRTILFTDLQGSTSLLNEVGQTAFMLLLTEHDLIIRRAIVAGHGREVKHTGDGIMASFDEVAAALTCAIAIQDGFAIRNGAIVEQQLHVRIGLAAGEPVDRGDDLFGATVNLASRICDAAAADQVLVSDAVRDHGAPLGFRFSDVGSRQLKGFAEPIPVFELGRDRPTNPATRTDR